MYLRARWYDAGRGRFVGRDPFDGWGETPYSLHPYQYGYADPVWWTDPRGKKVNCKAAYVTNPFTGAIVGGTYACLGAHVVNLSSSPIRISGAFVNGACSSTEVLEEMRAHSDGQFHGTRCVVDGTINTEATGDFHILYPHESSNEYGYFDVDGGSALRPEDLPGIARRSFFYDRGTFYDSSWRYHTVNSEKTLVVDGHDIVGSGGICREHLAIFQMVYRDAADLRSRLDPTNETMWPWNPWALPGEQFNLRYPTHPLLTSFANPSPPCGISSGENLSIHILDDDTTMLCLHEP